jgi:hypothetical protein
MMLRAAFVLLLSLAACSGDPRASSAASGPALRVGEELTLPLAAGLNRFVLPLTSRSEVVPRAALDARGRVTLGFDGPARAALVEHADDARVLWTAGGYVLVGAPRLPDVERDALAHLARQDGATLARGSVARMPADGLALVAVGEAGPTSGRVLRAAPGTEVALEVGLDQLVAAAVAPLRPAWTACHGGYIVELPALDQGRTATVLLELEAGAAVPRAREARAPAAPLLRDVSRAAGVDFVHLEGPDLQLDIRPTMGPGAAWGDVDGDGWNDLFLAQGDGRGVALPDRLYRNLGDGRFEDATDGAGLGAGGAGMGALFFDADGDGDLDLYVAQYGLDALYANDGAGHFRDVSRDAGLALELWSAGVAAADYDGDGDLDLYVTSYLDYDPEKMPPAEELSTYQREDPLEMLPFAFPGQRNVLLRNDSQPGKLAFTDVTLELGVANEQGLGMQAIWWDFDRDGDPDLYVANDVTPNALFRNDGDGTFTDVTFAVGLDDPRGGMGLALGDVEGDGDEDVFLTNWQLEANALYLDRAVGPHAASTRRARFHDGTVAAGLGPAGIGVTSWGPVFFDLELDGDLDLFVANGYTSPDYASTGVCLGQPDHLFTNDGRGRFTAAFERLAGAPLASRGAVGCDYDRDGRVDVLVTANNGRARLLHNEAPVAQGCHWLGVRLAGAGPNTFGVGAVVTLEAGERRLVRSLAAGTGYLTGNAPELHFGLGPVAGPVSAVVRWPSGAETRHAGLALDGFVTLEERR